MGDWQKSFVKDLIVEKEKSKLKVSDAVQSGIYPFYTSGENILYFDKYLQSGENLYLATGGAANIKYFYGEASYSSDTYTISSNEKILCKYLYYYLFKDLSIINSKYFLGSGLKHLQKKDFKNHIIVFPRDIKEQKEISCILSKVDEIIEKTKLLISKYNLIKKGVMQDLLTYGVNKQGNIRNKSDLGFSKIEEYKIPKTWEIKIVGDCIEKIEQGWSPNCESNPASPFDWGVLKTSSVTWEGFKENENKRLPLNLMPKKQYEVKGNDVLITRAGPNSRVGVVSFVKKIREKLIFSDKIYRLSPNKKINPQFLSYALSSQFTQKYLGRFKTGMAESQTNISQGIVLNLKILIPPIDEQELIVNKLESFDSVLNGYKSLLGKTEQLKTALMQDLLEGKVKVHNLNDKIS